MSNRLSDLLDKLLLEREQAKILNKQTETGKRLMTSDENLRLLNDAAMKQVFAKTCFGSFNNIK